jgi:polyhydroxyalkanoate synthesis regulator protein
MVPGYLEFSLGNLLKEQDKLRQQMMGAFGGDAFKAMEEQARRNMQLFQDSLKMFPAFSAGFPPGMANPFAAAADSGAAKPQGQGGPSRDELQSLKEQLAAMQQKIDQLNKS